MARLALRRGAVAAGRGGASDAAVDPGRDGVGGGASYDGLVALEAAAHDHVLLTRDARAQDTYRRLGVAFRALA
jgi:hypothetical protein